MFGKINLALGINSKPQSSTQQTSPQPNNNQQKPNPQFTHSKPLLSNPKFVHAKKQPQSGKQYVPQQQKQTDSNKTKPISKNPSHFNNNTQNNKKNHNIQNNNTQNNNTQNNNNNLKNKQQQKPQISTFQAQMQGSKFRILNELLYTSSSQQAMKHFEQNPEDYLTYHEGYRSQSEKWESKPVNVIIKYFRRSLKLYKDKIICDLGCGQGFLYQGLTREKFEKQDDHGNRVEVRNKHSFKASNILSFDLVALKPFIQVADIKNLPLSDQSVDVVVFCLSLMGKNYLEFIKQAHRVLREDNGELIIAQVESRSKNWRAFGEMVEMVGFQLVNNGVTLGVVNEEKEKREEDRQNNKRAEDKQGRYFRILQFRRVKKNQERVKKIRHEDKNYTKENIVELSQILLTECIYKKR